MRWDWHQNEDEGKATAAALGMFRAKLRQRQSGCEALVTIRVEGNYGLFVGFDRAILVFEDGEQVKNADQS